MEWNTIFILQIKAMCHKHTILIEVTLAVLDSMKYRQNLHPVIQSGFVEDKDNPNIKYTIHERQWKLSKKISATLDNHFVTES